MSRPDEAATAGAVRSLLGPLCVALLGGIVLTGTNLLTSERISSNEQRQAQQQLRTLLNGQVSAAALDQAHWDVGTETFCVGDSVVLKSQTEGYAGTIELLIAMHRPTRQLLGVTVTRHLETPGIADFLNDKGEDGWLSRLRNRAAGTVSELDTVSGATISSSAILRSVTRTLQDAAPDTVCAR